MSQPYEPECKTCGDTGKVLEDCPTCGGSGDATGPPDNTCPTCYGQGQIVVECPDCKDLKKVKI
jgi:DnaJ-class molecular chaperone